MGRRAGIKETAKLMDISEWELRTGAQSGKYPHFRIGNSKTGRIIFDIDLLEDRIRELMLENVKDDDSGYGTIRKIK